MSKRPLAWRHLARLKELTSVASIVRVVTDRHLTSQPLVVAAAAGDRALAEEVVSLARERGWQLPEPEPYQWGLMGEEADVLPRVTRIVDRDQFELDDMARHTDDEEVRSLANQLRGDRLGLLRALEAEFPAYSVPGAK